LRRSLAVISVAQTATGASAAARAKIPPQIVFAIQLQSRTVRDSYVTR
jgi:hypothetical protein